MQELYEKINTIIPKVADQLTDKVQTQINLQKENVQKKISEVKRFAKNAALEASHIHSVFKSDWSFDFDLGPEDIEVENK